MHLVRTIILITAAVALVACSSKAKKTKTSAVAPDKTSTPVETTADTSKSNTDLNTSDSTDSTPTKQPTNLGQVIYFQFDSSTLADEARTTLDNNATWLKENKSRVLLIEGHTDEVGTSEYNLGLGQRRATTARAYLVRMGIDKSRIKIITFGEERPSSKVAAQNRRSMFIATKNK